MASLVRCPQAITRSSSPGRGAAVTFINADARLPASASLLSRSEYDDRIQCADNRPLTRSVNRAPMRRLARAWELSRLSVGGTVATLPALTNGGDPKSSIVRMREA